MRPLVSESQPFVVWGHAPKAGSTGCEARKPVVIIGASSPTGKLAKFTNITAYRINSTEGAGVVDKFLSIKSSLKAIKTKSPWETGAA